MDNMEENLEENMPTDNMADDMRDGSNDIIEEEMVLQNEESVWSGAHLIAGSIILAAIMISGSILWASRGGASGGAPSVGTNAKAPLATTLAPISKDDHVLGDPKSKVTLVMYEDFQCPFCGRFFKDAEEQIRSTYVKDGKVAFVYRDFAFLGAESTRAAEAAECASDQGKFWEYHDYLYNHQNGENKGAFADKNLKSFASILKLNTATFNQCFDSGKYTQAVADDRTEGGKAGVQGTPKGFILKNGKVVDTIDGYMPLAGVSPKLDAALK